jgi:hypothetical protein
MARTRSMHPSQPNDASQEPQRGENPMEPTELGTPERWEKFRELELKRF